MHRLFLFPHLAYGGVIMKVSEAINHFMNYQQINSGKKYGQELSTVSGKV
jgi:hypothetical protein